jgi:hypothetical protein
MSTAIEGVLLELFKYGQAQVKAELAKQSKLAEPDAIDPADLIMILAFIRARTRASVNIMAARLKSAVTFEALRQLRQGILDAALLTQVMTDLSGGD